MRYIKGVAEAHSVDIEDRVLVGDEGDILWANSDESILSPKTAGLLPKFPVKAPRTSIASARYGVVFGFKIL